MTVREPGGMPAPVESSRKVLKPMRGRAAAILAAIRKVESNDDYTAIKQYGNGLVGRGAYQITSTNWENWSRGAGIPGADWRSKRAQDRVAAYAVSHLLARYGNPDLVSLAWYGGTSIADKVARANIPVDEAPFSDSVQYVQKVRNTIGTVPEIPAVDLPDLPPEAESSWLMPVAGANTWSESGFLYKRTPQQVAAGKTSVHQGIDIFAAKGTPIVSPVAGNVVGAGYSDKGGYWTKIKGDDGIDYYFAHMDQQPLVGQGQRVGQGFYIGFVGNSGNAANTKPHLHFTMHNSADRKLLNPAGWLNGGGTASGAFRAPDPTNTTLEPWQPTDFLSTFVDSASSAVTGGQDRVDYRTLTDAGLEVERDVSEITLTSDPWKDK